MLDGLLDGYYSALGGFFPTDGMLSGPEVAGDGIGRFTYHVETFFTDDASASQFVTVTGDADVWVSIEDELAIDLGGAHGTLDQRREVDRFCLNDGGTCRIAFFLANRYAPRSRLRIETNLLLDGADLATAGAGFD